MKIEKYESNERRTCGQSIGELVWKAQSFCMNDNMFASIDKLRTKSYMQLPRKQDMIRQGPRKEGEVILYLCSYPCP